MKNIYLTLLFFVGYYSFGQTTKKIFGIISDGKSPIENVTIQVLNTDIYTTTDGDGKYSIEAAVGDKLQYSYTGMRTISILVEDVTRILNPVMAAEVTNLDEVTVRSRKKITQKDLEDNYNRNKNIFRTSYGYVDAEKLSAHGAIIDEVDINPHFACILELLANRIPSLKIEGDCINEGEIYSRRQGSRYSAPFLYDVDGYVSIKTPEWIPIGDIRRIAVFSGLSYAAKYGRLGAGGVIIINTKNGVREIDKLVKNRRLEDTRIRANGMDQKQVLKNAPLYLQEFEASTSLAFSKKLFDKHIERNSNSPYFILDAYTHFTNRFNEFDLADNIVEENFNIFQNNAVLLKALAYTYESQDRFEKAHETYIKIFILRPNYAQSYLDMANSYRNIGAVELAAGIYARYNYLLEDRFMQADTTGFQKIMKREYDNLLNQNKKEFADANKFEKMTVTDKYSGETRLVFEWNDSEAEFDLQFVNPNNQYDEWKHSLADNSETIYIEKEYGYNTKEFLLDSSTPGIWKVNMNYMGNKSLTPTYLKVTIYYDYGNESQQKETKVFKLHLKNVNQELFTLRNVSSLASN